MKKIFLLVALLASFLLNGQKRSQVFPPIAPVYAPWQAAALADNPVRFYGPHAVLSLIHQQGSILGTIRTYKDAGYNVVWAFCDAYNDGVHTYYETNLDSMVKAAAYLGGIKIIPGFLTSSTNTAGIKKMILDMWNRDGVLKINGKPVFMGYGYQAHVTGSFNQTSLDSSLLATDGIYKTGYILIANTSCPYSEDNRATWFGETTNLNGIKTWNYTRFNSVKPGQAPSNKVTDLNHQIDEWPWTNGLSVFAVDQTYDQYVRQVVLYNQHVCDVCNARKLEGGAWPGYNLFYASASYTDYGYEGIDSIFKAIIAMPVNQRPLGMIGTTANDFTELSYETKSQNDTAGIFYVPTNLGQFYGTANTVVRAPLMDHSGIVDFLRPHVKAFLNNQTSILIESDEIFCKYQLHPKSASFISTIPAAATARGFNQTQWDATLYKLGSAQITGIKLIPNVDDICMAAHLTRPGYLVINTDTSALKPAGTAFHRKTLSSYTGTPTFKILNADKTVRKSATGPQAISTSCYPGGWNPLIRKLYFFLLVIPAGFFKRRKSRTRY